MSENTETKSLLENLPQNLPDGKFYMIRRRKDGLYSCGSTYAWFSETGKMWKSLKTLNAHLTMMMHHRGIIDGDKTVNMDKFFHHSNPYFDCEIVVAEYNMKPMEDLYEYCALRKSRNEAKKKKKK